MAFIERGVIVGVHILERVTLRVSFIRRLHCPPPRSLALCPAGSIYYIVIPVVIVVVILKLCLIFWRIWLYQRRRERVYLIQQNQRRPQPRGPAT